MNTKYALAGFGLTVGLAVASAAAPALAAPAAPEPITAQVTKATSASRQTTSEVTVEGTWATPHLTVGSTLDGIGVALVTLLIGAALVIGGHIIDRRFTK